MSDSRLLQDDRFFFGVSGDLAREQTPGLTELLDGVAVEMSLRLPLGADPAAHVKAEASINAEGVAITLTALTEEGRRALLRFAGGAPFP